MKVDFNEIKTKISLADFLWDHYGWTFEKGSSNSYPKMKSPNGGQTIVIKRNQKGVFTYFDVHNDKVRGKTILDLCKPNYQRMGN